MTRTVAKWILRFHTEKTALWRRAIEAKYTTEAFNTKPGSKAINFAHGTWRNIYKQRHLIYERTSIQVRDRASTSFWYDQWLFDSTLASTFPRLYALSLRKTASVKQIWNSNLRFWDMGYRRLLKDEEISYWALLSSKLEITYLHTGEDTWNWPLDSKGTFSTKSLLSDIAPKESYLP